MNDVLFTFILITIQIIFVYLCYYNGKTFFSEREKQGKTTQKIFDISHKFLPNYSDNEWLNILMNIVIFSPLVIYPHIIGQFLSYIIPVLLFRYITTNTTILPKTKNCNDDSFSLYNFINGHCYDKIFSGHFACGIIISLLLYHNNIIQDLNILGIYNIIIAYLLLVTRSHYTVDLILGGYVAITSYYLGINIEFLKNAFRLY
jgi:hypothetical protein